MDRRAVAAEMRIREQSCREAARLALPVVDVWTFVLAMGISAAGLGVSFLHLPLAPLIGAVVLLHWLLLARVLARRRWARTLSPLPDLVYLFPPSAWRWTALESIGSAAVLAVMMACVAAGWPELKSGW